MRCRWFNVANEHVERFGYLVGTCFEIGCILQANVALYFSEQPADLPIEVPRDHIATAAELVERFESELPQPILHSLGGLTLHLETNLVAENYQNL